MKSVGDPKYSILDNILRDGRKWNMAANGPMAASGPIAQMAANGPSPQFTHSSKPTQFTRPQNTVIRRETKSLQNINLLLLFSFGAQTEINIKVVK